MKDVLTSCIPQPVNTATGADATPGTIRCEQSGLGQEQENLRLLIDSSSDWIYWIAPDGCFLFVSSACERITGYPARNFREDAHFMWSIVHPDEQEVIRQHVQDGEVVGHEPLQFRIFHADGSIRWIAHTCSPIIDERGQVLGRRGVNRDITDQVLAEHARQQSEDRYKAMIEGIDSCVAVYQVFGDGEAFVIAEFNRAAEISTQVRREEVLGKRVEDVFPGIIKLGLLDVFQRVWRTGKPESYPVQRYADHRLNIWVKNYVYRLASGDIVAVYTDQSVAKKLERDLEVSQRRFKEAVEAASDGIWEWNLLTQTAFFGPRYFSMLGYEPDEFEQNWHGFSSRVHPDDLGAVEAAVAQHVEHNEPYNVEFRMRRKNGGWHWILARGCVVERDAAQRPMRMVGTHIDIHAHKELQQRIQNYASELEKKVAARTAELQKFHNAVEHSPVSIVVTDTDGIIEYVNPFFSNISGYSFAEAVGNNPRILKSGLHDADFYAELWQTISQGHAWRGEMCNRKKDGQVYWELMSIAPVFDTDGQVGHYVAIKEDISDKKDLERLKEDVDRIMRHDLKTPLNAIIGLPQVLAMDANITAAQAELLHALEDSGRKMLAMIDRSLDLFKMELGSYEYQPRAVDIISVLGRLIHQQAARLSAKNVHIFMRRNGQPVVNGTRCLLVSEESLLSSLLSNIVLNALEASPADTEVCIDLDDLPEDAPEYEFRGHSSPLTYVHVRNTGAVPKQIREHFFEKYITFGKKQGTGLGTYSAKLLATTMGYDITMHTSDIDNETVVSILAPTARATA